MARSFLFNMEIWKDVIGYKGLYEISSCGRVKSLPKIINTTLNVITTPTRIMKGTETFGYIDAHLRKNGTSKRIKVHRLVASAFIKNEHQKPFVNHKDGNKRNNHINNLEWCTASENTIHAYKNGLVTPKLGEANGNSKLKNKDIDFIMANYNLYTKKELAKMFNISERRIFYIKKYYGNL